jgi:hypothetical protein
VQPGLYQRAIRVDPPYAILPARSQEAVALLEEHAGLGRHHCVYPRERLDQRRAQDADML